jgi:hypothetical protein
MDNASVHFSRGGFIVLVDSKLTFVILRDWLCDLGFVVRVDREKLLQDLVNDLRRHAHESGLIATG